jgi:hypothetical protein
MRERHTQRHRAKMPALDSRQPYAKTEKCRAWRTRLPEVASRMISWTSWVWLRGAVRVVTQNPIPLPRDGRRHKYLLMSTKVTYLLSNLFCCSETCKFSVSSYRPTKKLFRLHSNIGHSIDLLSPTISADVLPIYLGCRLQIHLLCQKVPFRWIIFSP